MVAQSDESTGITELLKSVKEAEQHLQEALSQLTDLVRTTAEAPLMPNYQRAENQLRTALRAASGAGKALSRRLQLARQRSTRRP